MGRAEVERMIAEQHEGSAIHADTGYWYIQCSCGMSTYRYLRRDYAWKHHEAHQQTARQTAKELRRAWGL